MRAIILAGGASGRQQTLSEGLPRPFWPLVMRPLVSRLIDHLVETGVEGVSVCANGHTSLYSLRLESEGFGLGELRFARDPLPRGPAGCIKDNEAFLRDEPFLVCGAASWFRDSAQSLLERHRRQGNKLTVFCIPNSRTPSGVYVCDPDILQHIPAVGYCDIKEQLLPRLLDRGLRVGALPLRESAAEVVSARSYLLLNHRLLSQLAEEEAARRPCQYDQAAPGVWISRSASVSQYAKLFGPVIVGPGAIIASQAVIIGPAAIGPHATIDRDVIVTESVIWEGVKLSRGRCVSRTVVTAMPAVMDEAEKAPRVQRREAVYQGSISYA